MHVKHFNGFRFPQAAVFSIALAWAGVMWAPVSAARADAPDLSIGAAQYPDDDAIILRWEQHWWLDDDGAVHQRNHYWVRLMNQRPIDRFGDPRIGYVHGHDRLIFHKAQSILPDGTVLPVPNYSFNPVGPDEVAGWPEYADWQEMVVSFSGIEPGIVLELDYEIITPPGDHHWIDADIRLDDEYPIVERIVSVNVPRGVDVRSHADRAPGLVAKSQPPGSSNPLAVYRWTINDLPGDRSEPQTLPWQQRCPRLRFTTCPDEVAWTSAIAGRVEDAAKTGEAVREFAKAAVEEEVFPVEQVRKVAKKLHDSFNFVNSSRALRGLACRKAEDVLHANYGNRLESAAVLLAALRSLGMNAVPLVGVDALAWSESAGLAPTDSAFASAVVRVDLPEGPVFVHPQHGVFENPGHWGRHWLLSVDSDSGLNKTYVYARGEKEPSNLRIAGKIVVDAEGRATGELRFYLTGGFYDPAALDTADAQEKLVKGLVGRVLSDFDIAGHSVVTLSDDLFQATANVKSPEALKKFGDNYMLKFGDGPAFLHEFHLPLDREDRRADVYIGGRLHEQMNVTVELPKDWKTSIIPASLPAVEGPWGRAVQTIELDEHSVRFHRDVALASDTIAATNFAALRAAINDLRTPQRLVMACGK